MNNEQIRIIKKLGFSEKDIKGISDFEKKYSLSSEYNKLKDDLLSENIMFTDFADCIGDLASRNGDNAEELNLLFLFEISDVLFRKYQKANIPEDIIYDTLFDIKIKAEESARIKGHIGILRLSWYKIFYNVDIFKLGRFQYALSTFYQDYYEKEGVLLKKGMPAIYVHIPQSGEKMDDEARGDSYKKAYDFFKRFYPELFQGNSLPIVCKTWLFFHKHKDFLDENSSIVRFTSDFDIIENEECEIFNASKWLFDRDDDGNYSDFPQKTTLQRAYVKWLSEGNKTGVACGVRLLKF